MKEMDYKKKIRKFRCRLYIEAGIQAGTVGVAVGLLGMAAVLLYGRLGYRVLLIKEAVVAALILFAISTLLVYFFRLRPKKKEVLQRIDALGLKERMITMEELKQEETVLAKKQRQDAKEHLAELNVKSMKPRLYIKPLICCAALAVIVIVLLVLPFPKEEVDELAEQDAMEMELVDELVDALKKLVEISEINEVHKAELYEIADALSVSFTPEDSTLTRTAKIATASKRLDLYEASEQAEVTLLKQQVATENAQEIIQEAQTEQKRLSQTIKNMKSLMGTSIDVLNNVAGTFWTPEGPTAGTSYDVEPLPTEDETEEREEPVEGEEPAEGEEPPEGMEPGEGGEPPEGEESNQNGAGSQTIFDPEQGEVSYGSVYEEYYKEILKALTEQEFSEEIRKMIESYANSLE